MNLISLASKQIWPQVLAVQHLQPSLLTLLHTKNAQESQRPASRLSKFFRDQNIIEPGRVSLAPISDSDFAGIVNELDHLSSKCSWNLGETVLNITGGNKLMATAAFTWAAKRGVRTFYLERRNSMTWFYFEHGEIVTDQEEVDGHSADSINPVALLRCQMEDSEIERLGESITLNEQGIKADEAAFRRLLEQDHLRYLQISGTADLDPKEGDSLELVTAGLLLKLGVKSVQRSLRLKVKNSGEGTRKPHAEIDLLFSWEGRLWIVDCKDKKPSSSLVEGLKRELYGTLSDGAQKLLKRINDELENSQTKELKHDILAARELGGLLGNVVCVRKSQLPPEAEQFAKHNRIKVVLKNNLLEGLKILLFPDAPADAGQINTLKDIFNK